MWTSSLSTLELKRDAVGETRVRKDGQGKIQVSSKFPQKILPGLWLLSLVNWIFVTISSALSHAVYYLYYWYLSLLLLLLLLSLLLLLLLILIRHCF